MCYCAAGQAQGGALLQIPSGFKKPSCDSKIFSYRLSTDHLDIGAHDLPGL